MAVTLTRWKLRWFVALWVFSGVLIGAGVGFGFAESSLGAAETEIDSWLFWSGFVLYFVVAGTLGRGYLRLVRGLR
jgi:hypothetical protein